MATGFDPNKFIKGNKEYKNYSIEKVPNTLPALGGGGTEKKKKDESTLMASKVDNAAPLTSLTFAQSNLPYMDAYKETNNQLDESITQLNVLSGELFNELISVRASKTLKNKYNYITDMTTTLSTIISTKITAIKEKNKTINDTNSMEIRRIKELKVNQSDEDDNQRIMNLYDAFINTPVGSYSNGGGSILGPSFSDVTLMNQGSGLSSMQVAPNNVISEQQVWESGLSPAENRMLLDAQGKIETVVMYDAATGNRWYEVVDRQTKQPVPNVEKPDNTFIYDLDINTRGGYAKDSNKNITYQLIVLNGENDNMLEY